MKKISLEVKQECLHRLTTLKVMKEVKDFFKKNYVMYSERLNAFADGVLYTIYDSKYAQLIADFESEHPTYTVYHAQLAHTTIGDMLALLFVDSEDLKADRPELYNGVYFTYSYVLNLNCEDFSEFGTIGIKPKNGGITRIY